MELINKFIKKARDVHGDKYDYSKVEYVNNKTKVCIVCPEHGEFWQRPDKHISRKDGCPNCGGTKKLDRYEFIWKAIQKHGYKYDYRKVEYKTTEENICIICHKHGEFWQTPHNHLSGCGCPICKESKLEKEIRIFLTKENILFESQKKNLIGLN